MEQMAVGQYRDRYAEVFGQTTNARNKYGADEQSARGGPRLDSCNSLQSVKFRNFENF